MICHSYLEKGALYSFLSNLTNKSVWRLKYAHIVSLRSTVCMASSHQYVWSISCWWIWQLRWFGQKPGPGTFYISRFLSPLLEISSSNYLVSNVVKIHKYMINWKSKNDTGIFVGLSSEKNSCDRLNRYQISCSIKIWGSHSAEHGLPGRKQQWI